MGAGPCNVWRECRTLHKQRHRERELESGAHSVLYDLSIRYIKVRVRKKIKNKIWVDAYFQSS
jgi:hypothetical protein